MLRTLSSPLVATQWYAPASEGAACSRRKALPVAPSMGVSSLNQAIVTESLGESRWAVRSVDPDPQRGRMFLDSVHAESGFSTENLIKIHRDFSQMKWKQ